MQITRKSKRPSFFLFLLMVLVLLSNMVVVVLVPTLARTPTPSEEDDQYQTSELLRRWGAATSDHLHGRHGWFDPGRRHKSCTHHRKVCHEPWSPGPDCCHGRCVDLKLDPLNCGKCGRRCRFGEVCCKGKCSNVMFDRKNCGRCSHKCKHGAKCEYGMCGYGH